MICYKMGPYYWANCNITDIIVMNAKAQSQHEAQQ